jgi:ATP-dependent Zn protease
MDEAYAQALTILRKNKTQLDKVAKALLEKETLDTDEFESIVGKKKGSTPRSTQSAIMA